ncbi:MAG: transcriptional repressor [Candidatus Lokiarchaeota archaeon]|nr:transcriptional repressor [Candidatus Lokiarchaeota archaeon]
MAKEFLESMIDRLREHGLRLTPQRLALLRVIENLGEHHPSFSEICDAVWKDHPHVSQSTILKNLGKFEELEIVRGFSFRGETHYEVNPALHVNFVDTNGRIVDIEDEEVKQILEELIEKIQKKTGVNAKDLLVMVEK